MTIMTTARKFAARFVDLAKDRRGAAAIEFAFVAPVLLVLYMMTMEIAQAIDTNKKVGRMASLTADLVTQEQDITKSEIDAIMTIGDAVLRPYSRSLPTIEVDAISIDSSKKATIAWSRKYVSGSTSANTAKGTVVTDLPAKLIVADSFLIRARAKLSYAPMIAWFAYNKSDHLWTTSTTAISMGQEYYLRPRIASSVTCTDC